VEYRLGLSKPWDVSRGDYTEGMSKLSLLPCILTKVVTNVVGATAATAGYTLGKLGTTVEQLVKPEEEISVADNKAFQLGFQAWLALNGIIPSIAYEEEGCDFDARDMRQTPLIVCNHQTYIDGMVLAASFGAPKIIAMAGTCKTPLVGHFAEEIGVIEVDRDDPNSRHATLEAIQAHVATWKPGDRPLLLFPEGTTSNGDSFLPFKRGAFIPGAPVRPVVLTYTGSWHPANTNFKETSKGELTPTGDVEWAEQFLGHFMHSLQVKVLAPYSPSDDEKAKPDLFAGNVRGAMLVAYTDLKKEVQARRDEEERNSVMNVARRFTKDLRDAPAHLMDIAKELWPRQEAPDQPSSPGSSPSRYAPHHRTRGRLEASRYNNTGRRRPAEEVRRSGRASSSGMGTSAAAPSSPAAAATENTRSRSDTV
jgi:1-acyl-sn-glycerol-3-phosphate acyltransferase